MRSKNARYLVGGAIGYFVCLLLGVTGVETVILAMLFGIAAVVTGED